MRETSSSRRSSEAGSTRVTVASVRVAGPGIAAATAFWAVQYHPELRSRPNRPHPLFRAFILAALANKQNDRSENSAVAAGSS